MLGIGKMCRDDVIWAFLDCELKKPKQDKNKNLKKMQWSLEEESHEQSVSLSLKF